MLKKNRTLAPFNWNASPLKQEPEAGPKEFTECNQLSCHQESSYSVASSPYLRNESSLPSDFGTVLNTHAKERNSNTRNKLTSHTNFFHQAFPTDLLPTGARRKCKALWKALDENASSWPTAILENMKKFLSNPRGQEFKLDLEMLH